MNLRDSRIALFALVAILGSAAASMNACGPRATAAPGAETPTAGSADPDDEQAKDPPMTEAEERAARERADIEPLETAKEAKQEEPQNDAEPEVDTKGRKKVRAPDSKREPMLKKP